MTEVFTKFIEELHYNSIGDDHLSDIKITLPKKLFESVLYGLTIFPPQYMTNINNPTNVVSFQYMGINFIKG